jgi:hypothetical protein
VILWRTKLIAAWLFLAAILMLAHLAVAQTLPNVERQQEPKVAKGFVGSPAFETKDGPVDAGTAFLMRTDRPFEIVLLTALHLFGPSGGLATQKGQAELPHFVSKVALRDLMGADTIKMNVLPVPIPSEGKKEPDLAVVRPAGMSMVTNPGRFAEAMPSVGETIWLAAHVRQPQGIALHPAIVTEIKGSQIYCKFLDQTIETNGGSGGPYLNAKGEVVGIHDGSIKTPGNKRGVVLWAGVIREILRQLR